MTFDSTFTNNSDNNISLRKKVVVGGAITLLLGVASYSSNGASNGVSKFPPVWNLLRSNHGPEVSFGCAIVTNQVQSAIANLDKELAMLDDPLVLEKDAVFTKEDVQLDKTGCKGDITITVSKGASVSGLASTDIELNEKACSFQTSRTVLTGQWELSATSPEFEVDATVTTKATNCDIDKSGSVTIKVLSPTVSVTAGLTVDSKLIFSHGGVNPNPSVVIDKMSLDAVTFGFGQAEIDLVPGGGHTYAPSEGEAITAFINDNVLPKVNEFFAVRLPKAITRDDVSSPEAIHALLEDFINNQNNCMADCFFGCYENEIDGGPDRCYDKCYDNENPEGCSEECLEEYGKEATWWCNNECLDPVYCT